MFELIQAIPFSYAALFPLINPLGSALIFLAFTQKLAPQSTHQLALRISINTFIMLVAVLLTGSWVLRFFGISIPIVQIGGGLVIAYLAWMMLNQKSTGDDNNTVIVQDDKQASEMAFFPLTMPITAGPGCMAVTITIGAHELGRGAEYAVLGQIGAIIGILLIALSVYFCYRYADLITQRLGASGKQVIIRISAFINFCIGLQIMWHGVQGLIG